MKLTRYGALACLLTISTCASTVAATSTENASKKVSAQANLGNIATLVKQGAKPKGNGGWSVYLYQAIKSDNAGGVRFLLTKGADPNYSTKGCGPLWDAFDASLPILQSLLSAGANPNCVWADPSGAGDQSLTTPLMAAASLKGLRMGGRRLAWTDKPIRKDTPQPVDVVRLLLKFGAHPNTRSYFGRNALYDAIDANDVAVARALIDGGLDVNATIDKSTPGEVNPWTLGQTALFHALDSYDFSNMRAGRLMIRMLLDKGADPNAPPYGEFRADCGQGTPPCSLSGETPLSYVAKRGYIDFARLLLEHGARPDEPRADGAMPAAIAARAGHVRTAALVERYKKQRTLRAHAHMPATVLPR